MRLDSGLQNRTLLKPAILPVVTHPSGLKPTRVRIGVSWDGRVRYALIEQGSGDPSADASAVEASRGMRFAPIQRPLSDAVSWALATCYWATTPPVAVESLEAETSP